MTTCARPRLAELVRLKRPEALPVAYAGLTRPDYHLVMTAARALEGETDKPKATAALLAALARVTARGPRHLARSARGDPDAADRNGRGG